MQSSLGKINFLQKYISNYSRIIRPIQDMINKDVVYNWRKRKNFTFICIKQAIAEEPALYSLYFNKDFVLCTFTSENSLIVVLT